MILSFAPPKSRSGGAPIRPRARGGLVRSDRREVIERHRKEVLGQLESLDADALADAVGNRARGRYDDAGRHRGRRLCRTGSRVE